MEQKTEKKHFLEKKSLKALHNKKKAVPLPRNFAQIFKFN